VALRRFLSDGIVPIDNGVVERLHVRCSIPPSPRGIVPHCPGVLRTDMKRPPEALAAAA
jgi:hypothetical protein